MKTCMLPDFQITQLLPEIMHVCVVVGDPAVHYLNVLEIWGPSPRLGCGVQARLQTDPLSPWASHRKAPQTSVASTGCGQETPHTARNKKWNAERRADLNAAQILYMDRAPSLTWTLYGTSWIARYILQGESNSPSSSFQNSLPEQAGTCLCSDRYSAHCSLCALGSR